VDRQTDVETGFTWSTWVNQPKNVR